jgi:hypothetical protein
MLRDGMGQDRPPQIMVADQGRQSDMPDCATDRRRMRGFDEGIPRGRAGNWRPTNSSMVATGQQPMSCTQ